MDLSDATVGQLRVCVGDFDHGVAFYRDTLGLPFLFAAPQMAFFQCGDIRLLVAERPAGQHTQAGSAIYFRVPDIHAVHASLSALGVAFVTAPHAVHRSASATLWLAEFRDPDGNSLALMSEAAAAAS